MKQLYQVQRKLREAARLTGLLNVLVDTVQRKDPGRLGRYVANRWIGRTLGRITDPLFLKKPRKK